MFKFRGKSLSRALGAALTVPMLAGILLAGSGVAQAAPAVAPAEAATTQQAYPWLEQKIAEAKQAEAAPKTTRSNNFKIVGGVAAPAYSFMGSLQITWPEAGYVDFHICGATQVSGRYLVTAAHCVTYADGTAIDPEYFGLHARVGSKNHTAGGELAEITDILVHPGWNWGTSGDKVNDVALLRVDHQLSTQHAKIPSQTKGSLTNKTAAVRLLGWGSIEPDGSGDAPINLQMLDTWLIKADKCAGAVPAITLGEHCVRTPNDTDGACYGDSGGPAIQKIDGVWQFVGITSRGVSFWCGQYNDIYTDVTNGKPSGSGFRKWLFDSMRMGVAAPA